MTSRIIKGERGYKPMKKVLVLGGTGFLGYYTTLELVKEGYAVKSVALPPMPDETMFEDMPVENLLLDINQLSDEEISDLLEDVDAVMYAIGADERTIPEKPAYDFFYQANVLPTQRLARLSAQNGVKAFVVYGSYMSEFAETMPELGLQEQAYPKTRLEQEHVAFQEGGDHMRVMSLRLPYIFGTMGGRMPLWKMFVEQMRGQKVYPALKGGTAMVTVQQVAEAAVGAMEKGEHAHSYALGGINMKYQEFYQMIAKALGQEEMDIPVVPFSQVEEAYRQIDQQADEEGVEHGIHMVVSGKMSEADLFIDPKPVMEALGYREDNVIASIEKTLEKCV